MGQVSKLGRNILMVLAPGAQWETSQAALPEEKTS
jgi:hypothetical protein